MSFARFITCIMICSTISMGVLPSDLVFTPHAEFPPQGQTEFGYQLTYYTINSTTNDKGFYFNHSFSDRIRYGIEFYENGTTQNIYHHFAFRLGNLFKDSRYHLVFSGGINYLSTSVPNLKNGRLYDGSLTTSWSPNSPIRAHVTVARNISNNDFITMGALSYNQHWGHLSIEWDGTYLNLSSQFDIYERYNFRAGITKDIDNDTELLFKAAFGFIDVLKPFEMISNQNEAKEDTLEIDTSVGLKHIQEGLTFFYNGEYRKAQKSYEIAVELFPESSVVYERLGSIYFKLGEYDKAKTQWEKANILTPSLRLERYILEANEKGESLFE